MDNWVKAKGILVYNPKRDGIKKIRKANDWILVVETDPNIAKYYRWWVQKRFGLFLNHTAWKTHISILNGKKPVKDEYKEFWKKYDKNWITFEYSVNVEQHWKFWTLPVRSKQLESIRKELGFFDDYPLHITIGRME